MKINIKTKAQFRQVEPGVIDTCNPSIDCRQEDLSSKPAWATGSGFVLKVKNGLHKQKPTSPNVSSSDAECHFESRLKLAQNRPRAFRIETCEVCAKGMVILGENIIMLD